MAEETNGAAPQQAPAVKMNVLSQYIRDMSFENILARKPATGNVQPDMKVQVALDAKKRDGGNQYEVMLKLTITSNNKESGDALFLMELEYVGLFHIEGVPDDQLHPFLLIECPRMLFPFARRIVSDVTRDGGFPPLNLETIDFVQLYRAEIQRRAAAQQAAAADTLAN
ncbi:protein-export chaperone SecB [Oceanicola sp. S124]|uniref:protein-export chaperone SecB n=1 Tax=Oceanicola sp. S124 TaxID=1042378 RepID=UPI000304815D|nr:protein-export chaperone SecB [Oceanicola sp. S124]